MSNIRQFNVPNKVQQSDGCSDESLDQASAFIAMLDRGLTNTEKTQLQLWLAEKPEHLTVLLEVAQMWDKLDDLSRLADLFPQQSNKKQGVNKWLIGLAASLVLAFSLLLLNGQWSLPFGKSSTVVAMQTNFQTGIGESNTIHLPDNTKVVLNTNTFVQVRYTQNARLIELQRGEIHIDVAHDKNRPLSVSVQGKVIQAVGTAFNVEVRNNIVELIVTDGKVLVAKEIEPFIAKSSARASFALPSSAMAISKGEKVDLSINEPKPENIVKVDSMDIAASLSWRNGNLIFRGETLEEAMAEISRYNNVQIELDDDEQLRQIQVAGMFKTGDVNGLLEVLSQNFKISFERKPNDRILLVYAG